MNTRLYILALSALLALSVSGCATAFTSIEAREDGTYTLTRIKEGFFNISSNVYHCTAEGLTMKCNVIND